MNHKNTLVISDKPDSERDALAAEWGKQIGPVLRLGRFWEPPVLNPRTTKVYGADSYCLVLAQKLGLQLISPDDDLIFTVPNTYLQRCIVRKSLTQSDTLPYPIFIKALIPKLFCAKVFQQQSELLDECKGLEMDTEIMVSEVVDIQAEARFFLHSNRIVDCSLYEGQAPLTDAITLIQCLVADINLPSTVVVDLGYLSNGHWCIIEFNASWGSGLNGCSPKKVLECINAASC